MAARTGQDWTAEQDAILQKEWPGYHSREAIVRMVNKAGPYRSLRAVSMRVFRLGLVRRRRATVLTLPKAYYEARKRPPEQPKRETRTIIRDGQKITICPPAYAWGAYRADVTHLGKAALRVSE